MIAFRKAHPILGRSTFWRDDIRWFGAEQSAVDMSSTSQTLAYCLQASSDDQILYVMINGSLHPQTFQIHATQVACWHRAIDTSLPYPSDGTIVPHSLPTYRVSPQSVVVLEATG